MLQIGSNLGNVMTNFTAMQTRLNKATHEAPMKAAHQCLSIIKQGKRGNESWREGHVPVDSGTLKRGHGIREKDHGVVEITNNVEYWIYVVYGTDKMPPRDYPKFAVQKMKSNGDFDKIMSDVIRGAFKF